MVVNKYVVLEPFQLTTLVSYVFELKYSLKYITNYKTLRRLGFVDVREISSMPETRGHMDELIASDGANI